MLSFVHCQANTVIIIVWPKFGQSFNKNMQTLVFCSMINMIHYGLQNFDLKTVLLMVFISIQLYI